jgi:hypothetical protein
MLADLHPVNTTATSVDPTGAGGVPGFGQRRGDLLGCRLDVGVVAAVGRLDRGQNRVDAAPGEVRTASSTPISRNWWIAADAKSS